jgi:hypothetical protein
MHHIRNAEIQALHCPNSAPDFSPRIEIPVKSQNISETHERKSRAGGTPRNKQTKKSPGNSIDQAARLRDARGWGLVSERSGNQPLVLEGDEGEGLGLHLPRRRPPSAVPPPYHPPSCLLVCLPGRAAPSHSGEPPPPRWRRRAKSEAYGAGVSTGVRSAIVARGR